MKCDPLVSIILPTYNGSRFLDRAIQSIVNQTYSNWELIVVDDASADDTPDILRRYVISDQRIRSTRHSSNLRLPRALNTGFAQAQGDYLTWTSDDNYYRPEALNEMVGFLETHPEVDLVYTDFTQVDDEEKVVQCVNVAEPEALLQQNCVGPCFLYRRQVRDAVGDYSPDHFLAEDYDYWLRVSAKFILAPFHRDLYFYRLHKASLTHTQSEQTLHQAFYIALARNLPNLKWVSASTKAYIFMGLARRARLQHKGMAMLTYYLQAGLCAPRATAYRIKQEIKASTAHSRRA
jgi:glycosyltransferase involved in cell wall biosynthesis